MDTRDDRRDERRSRSPGRGRSGGGRGFDSARDGDGQTNPGNNLHVSGLSSRVDNRHLEETFGKFGKVAKAQVMYDPHTRESRGFGFVTMDTPEEADAAVAGMNGVELQGRAISVEKARRGRARTPTPGRYYGPPKRDDVRGGGERPYEPRSYDSRYSDYPPRRGRDDYDDRRGGGGGRYDDRRYDDRRGGGGGYDRYDDRRGGGGYDDRRGGGGGGYRGREDRDYDRRSRAEQPAPAAAAAP